MIVYIYNKKTDQKLTTYKGVTSVTSGERFFHLTKKDQVITVDKDNVKLVVYGF